ncbi:MAG: type II toxin-antitoxin system VapC family toxin [Solirubrobacteraceae bacterium MAG38_C4-C5]|nr:type II toxin-antitoxin system VapC family toxin [Candidatus Siliceabacter maunaloa]
MSVVDASAVVGALTDDGPDGVAYRARFSGDELAAPELVDLEVASALRAVVARGDLDGRRARRALADLATMELERHSHLALLPRIWELRDNVTPYDAAYVALAETLGVPLVTGDARLAGAPGPRCTFEVLV